MPEQIWQGKQLQSLRLEIGQLSADIADHRQDLHILLGRISIWENNICGPTAYSLDNALTALRTSAKQIGKMHEIVHF